MYDAIKGHNGVWFTMRFIPAARKKKQIHQRIGATRTCDIFRKPYSHGKMYPKRKNMVILLP